MPNFAAPIMAHPATTQRVVLHDKAFEPFIPADRLDAEIDRLAGALRAVYAGKRPLFIGVLNGAYFFAAELVKRLDIECEITFVKVASYHGTRSSGRVDQLIGLNERINGRHVVILEDIVDTGNTMEHMLALLADHHPASVAIATMLFKPDAFKKSFPVDHVVLSIPNDFVVGSGLDHDGLGRNLPGIWRIVADVGGKNEHPK